MFLSIFKMMLNAERCSVLPSSTVMYTAVPDTNKGPKSLFKNIYTNMNIGEGVPVQGTSVVDPRIVYFESGSCLRTNF